MLRHNKRHFIDRKDILVNGWQKSTLQGQEKQEKEIELRISTSINVCHTTINSYYYKHFTLVKWSYAKHLEHAIEARFNVSFFSFDDEFTLERRSMSYLMEKMDRLIRCIHDHFGMNCITRIPFSHESLYQVLQSNYFLGVLTLLLSSSLFYADICLLLILE